VLQVNLEAADDETVWAHAADGGLAIVTKDDDFRQRGFVRGAPPKVIWVRLGNCTADEVEAVLRARHADVLAFDADPAGALLVLTRAT
jgi:predicted nuclease of predicted toxin-antitoxin system